VPSSGADQVTEWGTDSHARESTSFPSPHLPVIHRWRGELRSSRRTELGQAALVLVLEEDPPEDCDDVEDGVELEEDEPELEPESPEDDEEAADAEESDLAATVLLPELRLSVR
jgi:hypothetical protein